MFFKKCKVILAITIISKRYSPIVSLYFINSLTIGKVPKQFMIVAFLPWIFNLTTCLRFGLKEIFYSIIQSWIDWLLNYLLGSISFFLRFPISSSLWSHTIPIIFIFIDLLLPFPDPLCTRNYNFVYSAFNARVS